MAATSSRALIGAALEFYNRGELGTARGLLEEMLGRNPEDAHALHLRGLVAYREGSYQEAVDFYERAFATKRGDPVYLNHLGLALWRSGEYMGAERALRKAATVQPSLADATQNLAAMLAAIGRYSDAESLARELVGMRRASGDTHFLLGGVLEHQGKAEEAVEAFETALQAGTRNRAEALRRVAGLLTQAGRLSEAVSAFQELGQIPGQAAYALAGEGVVAMLRRDQASAERAFRAALSADPAHVDGIVGLASLRAEQGRALESEEMLRAALAVAPGEARLHNALAMRLLERGALAEGFREYAWRHQALPGLSPVTVPDAGKAALRELLRESGAIAGKQIIVVGEQGLGDELFFLRFVPLLAARGAVVQVVGSPQLAPLLSSCPEIDRVLAPTVRLGSRAVAVHAGDLPSLLMREPGDVPVPPPLPISPGADKSDAALQRLAGLPRPIAAVLWRAGARDAAIKHGAVMPTRNVSPHDLGAALAGVAASAVIVQRDPKEAEIRSFSDAFGSPTLDLSGLNEDLAEMCGLLRSTEYCVGVSSTNIHLRASLGLPADVLIPWPPEWRWGQSGDASPWFPTFLLHRQTLTSDWGEALASLRRSLAA